MNVLMSGMEWFTLRPGGLPRYMMDFSRAWVESGHRCEVLVRVPDVDSTKSLPPYVQGVPIENPNPFTVQRRWKEAYERVLNTCDFDVFNTHFAYYANNHKILNNNIPVITHFHGPWAYEVFTESQKKSPWKSKLIFHLQKHIESRVYRRSDQFIVLSRAFQDILVGKYLVPQERVHIIPGAVDAEKFRDTSHGQNNVREQLGLPTDKFVMVTVRRLARRMGLENLIDAIHDLRTKHPDLFLVVVGGGELYEELNQRVRKLGLNDYVRLTNRVPDEVLPQYYQAADLAVVPSIAFEGFGLVTVESMACGTPVAGTPIGGTREILDKFSPGLLFDGSTKDDIVTGLHRILSEREKIPTREETRNHALEKYTWDSVVPQIERVFQAALQD